MTKPIMLSNLMAEQPPDYDAETVDLLFEIIKDKPGVAMDQVKSLEARGAQGFSAATVLLGLASLGSFSTGHVSRAAFAFFVIALIGYLGVAVASLKLLQPASIKGMPSEAEMWRELRRSDTTAVKARLSEALAAAETDNDSAIVYRRTWAARVVKAVVVEAVAIGMALLLSHVPS